jgi:hypothetical protein
MYTFTTTITTTAGMVGPSNRTSRLIPLVVFHLCRVHAILALSQHTFHYLHCSKVI